MSTITIIDYGVGNLRSVEKAFLAVGHEAVVTQSPEEVVKAERVVLPGVGAFGAAMESLRATGMDEAVRTVVAAGKPFMGICLGLQLLFTESFELGHYEGLDLIPGKVVQFFQPEDRTPETDLLKVPHMGWNELIIRKPAPPLRDFPAGGMTYHVHSFYVCPEDPDVVAATARHGIEFCTAVWKDNIFASQFHPEKSGSLGLQILRSFGDWKP
jgi:glutamine amidotransferase